ncbi:hypothetical protein HBI01_156720 [Parastagonospora nodorum]|nr:hypothetical protein HBI01_156720 [Parastagonospora nodorum]
MVGTDAAASFAASFAALVSDGAGLLGCLLGSLGDLLLGLLVDSGNLVGAVVLDELDKVLDGPRARVVDRLDLAGEEVLDKSANVLLGDLLVLVVGELLVLVGALDGESGPGASLEVKVSSVLAERLGVDGGEVDGTLVLEGEGLQLLGEVVALLLGLGEDVGQRNASSHVAAVRLGANLTDEGGRGDLGELLDVLGVELLSEDVLSVVEGLVEDQAGLGDTLGLGQGGVAGGAKEEVVAEAIGDLGKGLVRGLVVGGKVGNEHDLVSRLELLEGVLGDVGDGREGLLGHVRDQAVGLALTAIGRDVLGSAEDLEGGVALDAVLLAQILLLSAVDLDQCNVLFLQRPMAMAGEGSAWYGGYGGLTLGEDEVVLLDKGLECVLVELLDIGCRDGSRKEGSADSRVLHGEVCNSFYGGFRRGCG